MNIKLSEIHETINSLNKHDDLVEYFNKNHKTINKTVKNVCDCYLIDGYIGTGDSSEPIDTIKDKIMGKLSNSAERLSALIQLKTPENLMLETYLFFINSLKAYCEYDKHLYTEKPNRDKP